MSPFKQRVITIVQSIPAQKVMSYGQVAVYAGLPRAARQVGWILNGLGNAEEVPWWRVVNNKGYLSIRGNHTSDKYLQKKLLEAEGIEVSDEFELDMKKYRYMASGDELKQLELPPDYIEMVLRKYNI